MVTEVEYSGVFDISDAEGINDSERLLMRLCRRSFLSLWSHANLHTDQDLRNGKGSAKEFADVLVVFGDDIIIFSDKHIHFQDDQDLAVAWARWYKRAILASAKQLHGAMGWLRRFQNRIFLDPQCTRILPIQIPLLDRARIHLVAVTRGSFDACARHFPGSLGTHQIKTDVEGKTHETTPFTIGVLDRTKHFVHVFDEYSLEVVMDEMDTITDFLSYLYAREKLLSNPNTIIAAAGEEQLIAAYISNGDQNGHAFLPTFDGEQPDYVWFDESHYPGLKTRPDYAEMRRANAHSQVWDEIIERFIKLGDPAVVHPDFVQPNHETEQALRLMAAESRFRRRVLVESISEVFLAAQKAPGRRRARIFTTQQDSHLVYVFLVMPKRVDESYDEYRRHRIAMLHAYGRCAKLKFPDGTTFIALGFDHPVKDYQGSSEDLFIYLCDEWAPEAKAEAERYRQELGILGDNLAMHERHDDEFPTAPRFRTPTPDLRNAKNWKEAKRKAKRKTQIAKASRRHNR